MVTDGGIRHVEMALGVRAFPTFVQDSRLALRPRVLLHEENLPSIARIQQCLAPRAAVSLEYLVRPLCQMIVHPRQHAVARNPTERPHTVFDWPWRGNAGTIWQRM